MQSTLTKVAAVAVLAAAASSAQAVNLNTGDVLTINPGAPVYDANMNLTNVTVSWFGMDTDNNSKIAGTEKTALSQGTTGIKIGDVTTAGDYHFGPSLPSDNGVVVDSWDFFGSTGSNFNTVAITGGTTGLDFSGWKVAWNNVPSIDMGGIAWGTGYTSGVANFSWDGNYGSTYTLDYHATVPASSANFPGVKYALHLEGTVMQGVAPIPEASTYGMMLAGLGLVGFAVRRRKSAI